MISKHFNITVFNRQTSVIKEACCLIELGNVKLPLVIFKMRTDSSEKNKNFFLRNLDWFLSFLSSQNFQYLNYSFLIFQCLLGCTVLFLCPNPARL